MQPVGKSGTFSWCAAAYLDNGEELSGTGSGTFESIGKHRWRMGDSRTNVSTAQRERIGGSEPLNSATNARSPHPTSLPCERSSSLRAEKAPSIWLPEKTLLKEQLVKLSARTNSETEASTVRLTLVIKPPSLGCDKKQFAPHL